MPLSRRTPKLQRQQAEPLPPKMTPPPHTGLLTPLISPEHSRPSIPQAAVTPRRSQRRAGRKTGGLASRSPTGSAPSASTSATTVAHTRRRATSAAGTEVEPNLRKLPGRSAANPLAPDPGCFHTTPLLSKGRRGHLGCASKALGQIRASDLDREKLRRLIRQLENGLLARQEKDTRLSGCALYPTDKHNFRFMTSWFQVWTVLAHMQTTDLDDDGETLHDSLLAAFTGALAEYESYTSLYYSKKSRFYSRVRSCLSEMKYFIITLSGDPLGVPPHWPPPRCNSLPPPSPGSDGEVAATATATVSELAPAQKWAEGAWHILTVRVLMPDTQDSRLWSLPEVVGGDPASVRWSDVYAALEEATGGKLDAVPIPHLWRFNTESYIISYNQAEHDGIIQDPSVHTGLDVARWAAESILDDDGGTDGSE